MDRVIPPKYRDEFAEDLLSFDCFSFAHGVANVFYSDVELEERVFPASYRIIKHMKQLMNKSEGGIPPDIYAASLLYDLVVNQQVLLSANMEQQPYPSQYCFLDDLVINQTDDIKENMKCQAKAIIKAQAVESRIIALGWWVTDLRLAQNETPRENVEEETERVQHLNLLHAATRKWYIPISQKHAGGAFSSLMQETIASYKSKSA